MQEESEILFGAWNDGDDAVALASSNNTVLLYRQTLHETAQWSEAEPGGSIDSIRWHPSGLVLLISLEKMQSMVLVDAALQTLCTVSTGWPLRNDVPYGERGSLTQWAAADSGKHSLQILSFLSIDKVVSLDFPAHASANWRSILRQHLCNGSVEGFRNACAFTLALTKDPDLFFVVARTTLRELNKLVRTKLSQTNRDTLLRLARSLVDHMDLVHSAFIQTSRKKSARHRSLALLDSCKSRYTTTLLTLGMVEPACQFALRNAERFPQSPLSPQLLDQIMVWSATFGQSDTIAPLARSAAESLRAYQKSIRMEGTSSGLNSSSDSSLAEEDDSSGGEATSESEAESLSSVSESQGSAGSQNLSRDSSQDMAPSKLQNSVNWERLQWEKGAGGAIVPEQLGRLLEQLEQSKSKMFSREMDELWREWRQSRAASVESNSVSGSPNSVKGKKPATPTDGNFDAFDVEKRGYLNEMGKFSAENAQKLGMWLECRGKLSQAAEVFAFHGLHSETERLNDMELATDKSSLDLVPDVTFTSSA